MSFCLVSCFGGCGAWPPSLSLVACDRLILLLEAVRLHPRLSFLRREVPDEGATESSGHERFGLGACSTLGDLVSLWARGPLTLPCLCSFDNSLVKSPLALDRVTMVNSELLFGKDEEKNGDTVFCLEGLAGAGIGFAGLIDPFSARECWIEVLLRNCSTCSAWSAWR